MEVDDFLQHYGTKGMKWGIRKKSSPRPSFMPPVKGSTGKPKWQSSPSKKKTEEPKTVTRTSSGSRYGKRKAPSILSEDAIQFRDLQIKVRKQGLQSLNNKDIELINKRAEVMSKYNKAYPKPVSPYRKAAEIAIDQILSDMGSKKLVGLIGGPAPRTEKKTRQAEAAAQLLEAGRIVREATRPKTKSK